jgi:RHS repeat-associated protein
MLTYYPAPPSATITPSGTLKICSTCSQAISVNTGTGYLYQWTKDGSPIIGATGSTYTAQQNGTYRAIITTNICPGSPSLPLILSLNQLPLVNAGTDITITAPASQVTLNGTATDPDGTITSVKWTQVSGYRSTIASNNTLSTMITGLNRVGTYVYRLTATDDMNESAYDEVAVIVAPPSNNYNWIREQVTEVAGATTVASVTSLPIGSRTERWTYFDGIGRPMQTVQTQNSPSKTDVNEPVLYDDYGRNARKYLPVTKGATGWYKSDLLDINNAYVSNLNYTNGEGDLVKDDTKSYSETVYESSPLNRPLQDFGTGQSWRDNNKYVLHQYPVNDATIEQVIAWSVSAGLPVRSAVSNTAVSGGNYTTGQLMIKSTTDEQGNEVREYVDKEGHTILKKVEAVAGAALNSNTGWAQTYYIYDDFGLLRFVLQPELVKKLVTATTWADPTATDLGRFAFQYQYDSRNRMTSKQVPGAQPVYMVYDQRDRLILTQDGNQRAAAPYLWTFNKYDNLNRPVLTGIKDTSVSLTQVQMQAAVDAHFAKASAAWGETFVGGTATGNIHGYTNKAYPVITGSTAGEKDPNKYLSVTYYDNYAFRNDWPFTYTYTSDNLTSGSYTQVTTGSENLLVTGRPTGAKTKVLDGGVRGGYTWLRSVTYYDDKYRVIQTQADNYKGGKDVVSNLYDFSGKVLKSKETHTVTTMQNLVAVKQVGNKWINTNTTSAWGTSGFSSIQQLNAGQDGWLEFVAVETNLYRMIGLSSSDPNTNYTSINYAMNLTNTGAITVYENGTSRGSVGSYIAGDLLRIERRGTTIKYYKNNQPLPLYTSTVSSSTALMVDVANYSPNATLVNVRTSFTSGARSITHTYVYDHAQRLTEQWHQVDNGTNYRTVFNQYNEIGQLVDKKLHSTQANGSDAKQSVDYRYNIRGWLTSMNNSQLANDGITNDDATDLFGMNLLYEQSDANLASAGLFNGNISGMKWSSNLGLGDTKETGYNFTYDALNRLQHANSRMNKTSTWQAGNYHENNLQYDLNGNITALQRYGDGGNQIDNLVYNYGAAGATSNQLVYVQDNTTNAANKVKGFADGQTGTATDYTYDVNGNMTRDLNKGIGTSTSDATNRITYNYLNLPEVVTKAGNTIQYMYTATGQKVAQVMTAGASIKQTDYVGAYVYENDVLQFINHEEGRVAVGSNQLIYSNSFNTTTSMTAANATLGTATGTNGETYVTVTAPATGMTVNSGVTGIGGTYAVQPGERYKVRVKGYRTAHAANLQITAGAVMASPGTALPSPNSAYESWVEQIVTIPASVTTMTIGVVWTVAPSANEVLYLNELDVTKLTTNATPEYQYHLKDHLGNVRLTFTTAISIEAQTATYEPASATTERANFVRYDNARTVNATIFDHTNGNATGYSERLNGSANEKYGLARSISVMPGDVIQAEVYAKYVDPNSSNWNSALSTLMAQIASNTAGVVVDGVSYSTSTSSFPVFSGVPAKGTDTGGPKAYLNWLVFDRNYNLLTNGSGYVQMTTVAKETGTDVTHEYLTSPSITISQPGYVYIYLSNEETAPVEVYFDDFKVTQTKSSVIQQQDYYPFGLTFNSYSRENSVANDYKYNSKEEQNELGLGWLDYGARMYMPDIGRWEMIDLFSVIENDVSPYNYVRNNPLKYIDPDGHYWVDQNEADALLEKVFKKLLELASKRDELAQVNTNGMSKSDLKKHNKEVKKLERRTSELTQTMADIITLGADPNNAYDLKGGDNQGAGKQGVTKGSDGVISIFGMSDEFHIHEIRHVVNNLNSTDGLRFGAYGDMLNNQGAIKGGLYEEISGYRAQYGYSGSGQGAAEDGLEIFEKIANIKDANNNLVYPDIKAAWDRRQTGLKAYERYKKKTEKEKKANSKK